MIVGGLVADGCGSSSSSSSSASPSGADSTGRAAAATTSSSSSNSPYNSSTGSSASAASTAGGAEVTTKHSKYGTILAAAKGSPAASGQAVSADLGTVTRSGGIEQVTYKGHPLYYFTKDKDDGDAYGEGAHAFGAGWYVLAPSGKKVDNS